MYDYVIVGAGSAGCVVAARLGEDPDVKVAVLEAGPPDDAPEIHMPAAFGPTLKSRFDWDLFSEPEPGLDFRRNYLPRGRVLGGSSSLNAMIYIRGNRADYDEWAALGLTAGATRTSCRTSSARRTTSAAPSRYHGVGGPLSVSDSRSMHPLVDAMIDAAGRGRHPRTTMTSTARPRTAPAATRSRSATAGAAATAVAYLHPAVARGNVDVLTDALVTGSSSRATARVGVELSSKATTALERSAPSAR